jgi:NADH:ubiquinone oxidoreductase subunit 6 (subunit J)
LAIAILFLFVIMMIQIHIAPQERILNSSEFSYSSLYSFFAFFGFFLFLISSLLLFSPSFSIPSVVTFFHPVWAIEFKTMTDIETLAIGIAVAYPTA